MSRELEPFHPPLEDKLAAFSRVPDPYGVHRRLVAARADRAEMNAEAWAELEFDLAELEPIVELFA